MSRPYGMLTVHRAECLRATAVSSHGTHWVDFDPVDAKAGGLSFSMFFDTADRAEAVARAFNVAQDECDAAALPAEAA